METGDFLLQLSKKLGWFKYDPRKPPYYFMHLVPSPFAPLDRNDRLMMVFDLGHHYSKPTICFADFKWSGTKVWVSTISEDDYRITSTSRYDEYDLTEPDAVEKIVEQLDQVIMSLFGFFGKLGFKADRFFRRRRIGV